jgi:hypothetical protein
MSINIPAYTFLWVTLYLIDTAKREYSGPAGREIGLMPGRVRI